jgi:hypothetical protein
VTVADHTYCSLANLFYSGILADIVADAYFDSVAIQILITRILDVDDQCERIIEDAVVAQKVGRSFKRQQNVIRTKNWLRVTIQKIVDVHA